MWTAPPLIACARARLDHTRGEGPVELEDVDRQPQQVVEIAVPGAEVVQRHTDAELAHPLEDAAAAAKSSMRPVSVTSRTSARPRQRRGRLRACRTCATSAGSMTSKEAGTLTCTTRCGHALGPDDWPDPGQARARIQSCRSRRPGLPSPRSARGTRAQRVLGVPLPAQASASTATVAPVGQSHDGLIEEFQGAGGAGRLPGARAGPGSSMARQVLDGIAGRPDVRHHVPLAGVLGAVHGGVRLMQDELGGEGRLARLRHEEPCARPRDHLLAGQQHRPAPGAARRRLAGGLRRTGGDRRAAVQQDHGELVPAEPRDGVAVPRRPGATSGR